MEKNKKKKLAWIFIGVLLSLCIISCIIHFISLMIIEQRNLSSRCSPPIKNPENKDLEGTWVAGVPKHNDTLIIRSDGTYKQIVHVEFTDQSPIDYESDWQPWYITYSQDNIPYIHLKRFRFCGMNSEISCKEENGGGYDFCEDKMIYMKGEGILIVLETTEQGYFYLHYPLGSQGSWIYGRNEP